MAEGTVYQRKSDGRWVGSYFDRQGKRKYVYGRTKVEARQKLRAKLKERDEGASGDDPTLDAWSVWWLDQLDQRPTTIADYRYKIGLLPGWLTKRRLSEITPMDVHEALDEIAAKPTAKGTPRAGSTVSQVRTVLGNCLHSAQRYGHVTRNAARLAAGRKFSERPILRLTVSDALAILLVVTGHRLESLYRVALSLGLRQGECIGLRWEDVDLEAGTISVVRQITRTNTGKIVEGDPKTPRSRRTLRLPQVCIDALKAHRIRQNAERLAAYRWEDHGLVWPSKVGTPISARNLLRHLHGTCDAAGLPRVSFHSLRHSAATFLLAQDVPDRIIMDVLGHTDARQLSRYAHVTDSLRQDAADAMDRTFAAPPVAAVNPPDSDDSAVSSAVGNSEPGSSAVKTAVNREGGGA